MIIATAGHVDHGKTSLVRALTGTNTDRLPEEKKRGLTIDIGFAYLQANNGQRLAFIDVPGHEKFVRNMIAGVGMVDIAILVVAADDGPMPQTLEHMAILQLMAVRNIVAVITKVDLVDSDRVTTVSASVDELLQAAGFDNTRRFSLATNDQAAVTSLKEHIVQLADSQPSRHQQGYFRMAIDRSFTLDGSGTVVTGTVVGGEINKGDSVTLVSDGVDHLKTARVRSIHAQNAESESAKIGQRCALNIAGELSRPMLNRGDWLVTNSDAQCVSIVDVVLSPALFVEDYRNSSKKPLRTNSSSTRFTLQHWTPAHLHLGTADIPCRIALLNADELKPGEQGLARLICEKEFSAVHGDRFVLRDQSARKTIAGGRVLDPYPPKRGRSKPKRLQELHALDEQSPGAALSNLLELTPTGVRLDHFSRQLNLNPAELESVSIQLDVVTHRAGSEMWGLTREHSGSLQGAIVSVLHEFHDDNPDALGADTVRIKKLCPLPIEMDVLDYHLHLLVESKQVIKSATVYRLAGREATLSDADQKQWALVHEQLLATSPTPPRVTELAVVLDCSVDDTFQFLNHCVSHGKLYKVTDNRYFLPQTLRDLADIAISLSASDSLTVRDFRDQSGVGRNLVVELLEYFDRCRFTLRMGDRRKTLNAPEKKF